MYETIELCDQEKLHITLCACTVGNQSSMFLKYSCIVYSVYLAMNHQKVCVYALSLTIK